MTATAGRSLPILFCPSTRRDPAGLEQMNLGDLRKGARYWLDAARYADTHGYHIDSSREMWHWRDWVISAFNRNMPFNEFAIDQIAGEEHPLRPLRADQVGPHVGGRRALGEGDLDVDAVLERLRETYGGWLVVEQDVLPDPGRAAGRPALDQRANREFLAARGF